METIETFFEPFYLELKKDEYFDKIYDYRTKIKISKGLMKDVPEQHLMWIEELIEWTEKLIEENKNKKEGFTRREYDQNQFAVEFISYLEIKRQQYE